MGRGICSNIQLVKHMPPSFLCEVGNDDVLPWLSGRMATVGQAYDPGFLYEVGPVCIQRVVATMLPPLPAEL